MKLFRRFTVGRSWCPTRSGSRAPGPPLRSDGRLSQFDRHQLRWAAIHSRESEDGVGEWSGPLRVGGLRFRVRVRIRKRAKQEEAEKGRQVAKKEEK